MKKILFSVVALLAVFSMILPFSLLAADFRTEPSANISSSESVAGNVYLAGKNVTSAGTVGGDVVGAGGTILVTGLTAHEIIVAGGNISLTGNVGQSIRAVGGNILVGGKVLGDVSVAGGQITISGGDMVGDLLAAGGSVFIDEPINGDVHVTAGSVTLGSHAVINGNFTYTSSKAASIDSGAVIKGETHFNQSAHHEQGRGAGAAFFTLWVLAKLLMLIVLALILGLVFKRFSRTATERAYGSFWKYIGVGLIALIVLPVLAVLLFMTVIGIPLGILCLLAFVGIIILSWALAPILVGALVNKWISKSVNYEINWKTILLGALTIFILGLIPFVGWLVLLAFFLLSTGVIVRMKSDAMKDWR